MQRYLLNLTTGEISREGNGFNYEYEVVRAEEIEIDGGFQLRGAKADGTEFTATLTVDQYFEGKEFTIDNVEAEGSEDPEADVEISLVMDVVETVKADVVKAVEKAKREVEAVVVKSETVKGAVKRSKLIAECEDLIKKYNGIMINYFNKLHYMVEYRDKYQLDIQDDINFMGDTANEFYDIEHQLNDLIHAIRTNRNINKYDYMAELVALNID